MIFNLASIKAGKNKKQGRFWTPDLIMIGTAHLDQFENLLSILVHAYLTGFLSGRGGDAFAPIRFSLPPLGYAENSILHVNQL